ncbi:uncharacterized protein LOC129906699 [Episyrphus balteatus]|uniref:uncharacterized protein LOC129906699 n=1 Tax=Episyrphus balteatus TaxID=286459 RepID=UPI002485636B|nr:uncharacterized protein LOC129906699 [Episyrphus balteatus]
MQKISSVTLLLVIGITLIGFVQAKGSHKVHCTEDLMRVEIGIPDSINDNKTKPQIYLEGLKGYPDVRCQPYINGSLAEFRLSLKDFYECGVTRMLNKLTGKKVYYHKIIIEDAKSKEIVSVKCITTGPVYNVMMNETNQQHHGIVRRDVLPAGFQEPEDIEITTSLTTRAPEPHLSVGVRQGGEIVTGELNVSPGTPLTMEIYLDKTSAPVYGLGVTYMQVTDTKNQEETIIFNGCSVDPYLFDNFMTVDGDFLSAKFRAFKFPESTYVQFRATVNVCLDKCSGTPCSNGQVGFGRRKREISHHADPNKIYEISLATFIKVSDADGVNKNEIRQLEEKLRELKLVNQRLARNSRGSFMEPIKSMEQVQAIPAFVVDEKELSGAVRSGSERLLNTSYLNALLPIFFILSKLM